MTSLPDLFADAVADPPPSRLSADDVYTAWRRRRRQTTGARAALLLGVVTATVAGGISIAIGTSAPTTSGVAPPSKLLQLWRGDESHLYGVRDDCPWFAGSSPVPSPSVVPDPPALERPCYTVVASVDGGVTWAVRDAMWSPELDVLGPTTLVRPVGKSMLSPQPGEPEIPLAYELSIDAGVTWRTLAFADDPVEAIPPGGALHESRIVTGGLQVVDPMELTIRPLAHQPALWEGGWQISESGSTLWIAGLDRQTRIPAVAASEDRGRTWTVTTLPGEPPVPDPASAPVSYVDWFFGVLDAGGVVAYAIGQPTGVHYLPAFGSSEPTRELELPRPKLYRTADGGYSWTEMPEVPDGLDPSRMWTTTRGELVGCGPSRCQLYGRGPAWIEAAPPGLALDTYGDGTVRRNADAVYVSPDGWTWRRL